MLTNPEIVISVAADRGSLQQQDSIKLWQEHQKNKEYSLDAWNSYSKETREALVRIIRNSLEHVHLNAEAIVPCSLLLGPAGDVITLHIDIGISDIWAQDSQIADDSAFVKQASIRQLKAIVDGGQPHLTDDEFLEYVREMNRIGDRLSVADAERLLDIASP